jgi:lipopolysaccharide export LptBFGC system permease protein LptF
MNTQIKIYIAAALAFAFAIAILVYAIANMKIAKLESEVTNGKEAARQKQQTAAAKEFEAAQYKQKIEYLETKLIEINQLARKQDEELEKLNLNSRNARSDADAARRTRSITTTNAELCQKLAELGHPCE